MFIVSYFVVWCFPFIHSTILTQLLGYAFHSLPLVTVSIYRCKTFPILFQCFSQYFSVCLSISLFVSVSLCLSQYLSVCLSISLFVSVSLRLSQYLSVCLSISLFVSVSLRLSQYLSVCLSISLFVSVSLRLSQYPSKHPQYLSSKPLLTSIQLVHASN